MQGESVQAAGLVTVEGACAHNPAAAPRVSYNTKVSTGPNKAYTGIMKRRKRASTHIAMPVRGSLRMRNLTP